MNLEQRVFIAGEEAAFLADKIVGANQYGNDAARLLSKYSALEIELAALKQELQALREQAMQSQKWQGIALAKFGDGRTVQQLEADVREKLMKELREQENAGWIDSDGEVSFTIANPAHFDHLAQPIVAPVPASEGHKPETSPTTK